MKAPTHIGFLLAFVLLGSSSAHAQWTQFGGPQRNFHCPAGALAPSWPEEGPPVLWRRPLGDGYSGVLVDGERLYSMYRRDGDEVIVCLARASGETLWEHAYGVTTTSSAQQFGDGPSATPALAGNRLVAVGVGVDVHCLDKASGEVLWSLDIMEEFEIPMPGRGYAASPLVYGDLVILAVGGTDRSKAVDDVPNEGIEGGSVLALDLETGEIVWASQNFPGSKASPILIEFGGRTQVVVFMGNELAGLDPEDGALLWRHEHPTDYSFNCTTPVWDGIDTLVCSSSYSNRAEAVQLVAKEGGFETHVKWTSGRLRIHFTNMLLVDGRLYGTNGMTRPGMLTCLDAQSGKALWRERGFAKANLLYAGGPFLVFDEDGQLALATFTDSGPEIHGRVSVTDSHAFTTPTLVGTELFVRDRLYLTAFDLSPAALEAAVGRKGVGLTLEGSGLPDDIESFLGEFETESTGAEPSQVSILLESGRLMLDLPEQGRVRLALQPDGKRWEFVEDRTSGSTPRTLEFQHDADGEPEGFILLSPNQRKRSYRVVR